MRTRKPHASKGHVRSPPRALGTTHSCRAREAEAEAAEACGPKRNTSLRLSRAALPHSISHASSTAARRPPRSPAASLAAPTPRARERARSERWASRHLLPEEAELRRLPAGFRKTLRSCSGKARPLRHPIWLQPWNLHQASAATAPKCAQALSTQKQKATPGPRAGSEARCSRCSQGWEPARRPARCKSSKNTRHCTHWSLMCPPAMSCASARCWPSSAR